MKEETIRHLKIEEDSASSSRKEDHIDLAFKSKVSSGMVDSRFYYEPLFAPHPKAEFDLSSSFLGKKMQYPIWISSMTGGTEKAKDINKNLAKICGEFGLGMGLGSCRPLLYEDKRLHEFDVRPYLNDQPLMINLGIAQIEELIQKDELSRIDHLIQKLDADGLIIHVNPLQEWLQPEGDRFAKPAFDTISQTVEVAKYPIIVKEVGQGFGRESLKALLKLPIEALDLAGFGGTNFSKLELLRSNSVRYEAFKDVYNLGHTSNEMLDFINAYYEQDKAKIQCKTLIISGGIKTFLDGFYFIKKSKIPAIYAQASSFLKYAQDPQLLKEYTTLQIEGLKMAHSFLKIKA